MKLTVYIDKVFYNDRDVTDDHEIARLVKSHISHLGKVTLYYDKPYDELKWWEKWLRRAGSGM
jgi:hypothetical protein